MQETHRPGAFKQPKKLHKHGRHRSKGALDDSNKGKVDVKVATRRHKRETSRVERRNKMQQVRGRKREEATARKRRLGGDGVPPFLVAVVPLCAGVDAADAIAMLRSSADDNVCGESGRGIVHLAAPRFKSRFAFVAPPGGDLVATLDAAKVADTLVFLLSPLDGVDERGELLLTALFAQGLPSSVHVVRGLDAVAPKRRHDAKKSLQRCVERRFPKEKVFSLDDANDALVVLRHVAAQKQRQVALRDRRAHMLAEEVRFVPSEDDALVGTLLVSGYVRQGTSDYQASWIIDEDEEEEDADSSSSADDNDDHQEEMEPNEDEASGEDEEDGMEFDAQTLTSEVVDTDSYDDAMDMEEERRMLEKHRQARSEQQFPDEVDTPLDTSARTCRTISYVTIHVANVPRSFMEQHTAAARPIVLYGLLPHEQKMSVAHFVVKRCPGNQQPIKSKDRLVFHVGYRRFAASATFSEHTTGGKHKFQRFLPHDVATVATVYAPIMFPPASVIVFKEKSDGSLEMVAHGLLLSVNPDRIIVKRILLSGHPLKINRRSATLRYMFFNREDINWFKPVELRTKYGRRGHIKDGIGTHGHMKCIFDNQLKSQDTVMMSLYKRVFPKWTYDPNVTIHQVEPSSSVATSQQISRNSESSDFFA
ncbi:PREDICTED: pre-rRNA-processing protein TSR1 homolog [Priapulus caudatus]|uniref:Pre-rRNA-processing protein TSR1 homolog n=1 Tax=Priapulus caudatus TaxID=37621 RepID=A0ABM1F0B2_PRICU|nr:PREDICTED: pre-rRNA-processing protein TSR1 homolog [Priapulus caudatus]